MFFMKRTSFVWLLNRVPANFHLLGFKVMAAAAAAAEATFEAKSSRYSSFNLLQTRYSSHFYDQPKCFLISAKIKSLVFGRRQKHSFLEVERTLSIKN